MTNIGFGRSKIPLWFSPKFVSKVISGVLREVVARVVGVEGRFHAGPRTRYRPLVYCC